MRGNLDIEGNLCKTLDYFLEQMGKFSTNGSALKKSYSAPLLKKQEKQVTSHYDIRNDFYNYGLTKL